MYADIPNNFLSSNAGLFAQVHRHMDVICVRTQIFLKLILNVQRWIICAYEQVYHRDKDVSVKNLRICANNPALEDFVIQNYYKEFLNM